MKLKPWWVFGLIGVGGLAVTFVLAASGTYTIEFGTLWFDPYYAALSGFAFLVIFTITDAVGISIPEKWYHPKLRK